VDVWQRKELGEVKDVKEIKEVKETAEDQGAEVDSRKLKVESKELEESFRPVPTTAGGRKFRPLRGWGKREVGIGAGESWPGEVPKREWRPTIKNNVTIINN